MERHEVPDLNFQPIIEQQPFHDPAAKQFFTAWCVANDSIHPEYVDRPTWEARQATGLLEKQPDGHFTLYVPIDLHLWEITSLLEEIDQDTFSNNASKANSTVSKLQELGKTFENAGSYIAQRLPAIREGKELAQAIAGQFFAYGQKFQLPEAIGDQLGEDGRAEPERDTMYTHHLSTEETEAVDRFLAGTSLYQSRLRKVKELDSVDNSEQESLERQRQHTLAQYFRSLGKAYSLTQNEDLRPANSKKYDNEPWKNRVSAHQSFIEHAHQSVTTAIEYPKRELTNSILRRGMEILRRAMPYDSLPPYIKNWYLEIEEGAETLRDALQIDQHRQLLDVVRASGDEQKLCLLERHFATQIQEAVGHFQYKDSNDMPRRILDDQQLNCVGYSMLGGTLMDELGINYLVAHVPRHAVLLLVTSNGQVEWRDMQSTHLNEILTDQSIRSVQNGSSPITINDIAKLVQEPINSGLMFEYIGPDLLGKFGHLRNAERPFVTVFPPEIGFETHVLNNISSELTETGKPALGVIAGQHVTDAGPNLPESYFILAEGLYKLGRIDEAITNYQKAISINPYRPAGYRGLAKVFLETKRQSEAVKVLRQDITLNPKDIGAYIDLADIYGSLGRPRDAVELCRQATAVDPSKDIPYFKLGYYLHLLNHLDEAVIAFRTSIALNPELVNAYFLLGSTLVDQNKYSEAIEMFVQYQQLKPDDYYIYYKLGTTYRDLNQRQEAIDALQRFISLAASDPAPPEFIRGRIKYTHELVYRLSHKYDIPFAYQVNTAISRLLQHLSSIRRGG